MGRCVFNDVWLDNDKYKEWVRRDPTGSQYKAYCFVCKKTFELGKMGEGALVSHQKSKKHVQLIKAAKPAVPLANFLSSHQQESAEPTSASTGKSVEAHCVSASDILKAEILWTLKVVSSHYSYKSCEDNGKIFAAMFPDCQTAQNFKCGERKTSYLATFGIAPHFVSLLKQKVKAETSYVLLFDETLNKEMQEKQLNNLTLIFSPPWEFASVIYMNTT